MAPGITTENVLKKPRNHGLERHHKLQARNSDGEPNGLLLTAEFFEDKEAKETCGRKRKPIFYR
jgi:hypothetical protein